MSFLTEKNHDVMCKEQEEAHDVKLIYCKDGKYV